MTQSATRREVGKKACPTGSTAASSAMARAEATPTFPSDASLKPYARSGAKRRGT